MSRGYRFRRSVNSLRCSSAEEYWREDKHECVQCSVRFSIKNGHEFSPNCGMSDDGGQHEVPYRVCKEGTYNDGTFVWCQLCSPCLSKLLSPCTSSADSRCCGEGQEVQEECGDKVHTTTVRSTTITSPQTTTNYTQTTISSEIIQSTIYNKATQVAPAQTSTNHPNPWIALGAVTVLLCACIVFMFCIIKKKKQRLSGSSEHFKLSNSDDLKEVCHQRDVSALLSPEIQAAPLHVVLNHLDVVEELVLLLDPDTPGAKNTRHLAASCSIPFTWINYAYSMKDSRSPLIAVLEKVIAKYPYWNVGHLAGLLNNIGRNDAVAVLRKLVVVSEDMVHI